jgi:Lrp/AsnC family leucine-responsive transcriptional regulator
MQELDTTDKALLNLVQQDCKRSTKSIAAELHLSPTAIYERIKRLEREGYISAYVALLDPAKVHRDFVVFCMVQLSKHSRHRPGRSGGMLSFERNL